MTWLAAYAPDSDDVHVTPLHDLTQHHHNDCACGVTVEPVPRGNGTIGWLHTHHSLDGREHHEP